MKARVIAAVVFVLLCIAVGVWYGLSQRKAPDIPSQIVEVPKSPYVIIGTSQEGREIRAYTYGSGDTKLLFAGGMHGGYEWNSIVLAYLLIDYLKAHPTAVPAGLQIIVIPDLNPDGTYRVVGKEGRFMAADAMKVADRSIGRFNANGVDLNRNFDCKWQPTGTWRGKTVSAGSTPFSEKESRALRDFVLRIRPQGVIFWHSQANAVYASECQAGILPGTLSMMNTYATAAGYPAVSTFDAYPVAGDAEGWLASIGIPAITVELSTHESFEWEKNLAGIKAVFALLSQ